MPILSSRSALRLRGLAGLLALATCAFLASVSAAASPPLNRWEQLRAQDLRVAGVAYRLSVLNAGLCPNALAAQRGFVLHSIEQYDLADRQGAARSFGLTSGVGVMAVVANSPAERSGLKPDDQLVSANGRALSVAESAAIGAPSNLAVAFAKSVLAKAMAKGEVILRVSRGGAFHDLRFTADSGCASDVELVTAAEPNGWADGQRVVLTDGMLALCASDGDLALVLGHEFGHNLLRHSEQLATLGSASARLGLTEARPAGTREIEEEADKLGVRLARGASYDLRDALAFLARLLEAESVGSSAATHAAPARRLALFKAEIARR